MIKKRGNQFLACFIVFIFLLALVSADIIETKSILLKFSLQKGSSITKNLTISSSSGGEISLLLKGIDKGIVLSQSRLIVDKNEEKTVGVTFDSKNLAEGVYVGHVELSSSQELKMIPIIFEVESKDVFFDSNIEIPVTYSEISPGSRLVVQLNIFDLISSGKTNLNSSSVDVEYTVHDLNGNRITSEHESIVVNKQISFTKSLDFPKNIKPGQYVFSLVLTYKSSVGIASDMFTISDKPIFNIGNIGDGFSGTALVLFFVAFIFVSLILFFVYIIKDRDRMFLELRAYNNSEMERQRYLLNQQAAVVIKKQNKGVDENVIKKEIKEKMEKLKKKQRERVEQLKKLKGKGEINEMKKKLAEWKKEGYNTVAMEYKLKNLSTKDMKNILKVWKKKYNAD